MDGLDTVAGGGDAGAGAAPGRTMSRIATATAMTAAATVKGAIHRFPLDSVGLPFLILGPTSNRSSEMSGAPRDSLSTSGSDRT
ncbi:hypothetical protein D1871_08010 [Nakamurella silvestris]|nr:hypothetical protein D1871_08010 [Nakamurella silvestris]